MTSLPAEDPGMGRLLGHFMSTIVRWKPAADTVSRYKAEANSEVVTTEQTPTLGSAISLTSRWCLERGMLHHQKHSLSFRLSLRSALSLGHFHLPSTPYNDVQSASF